jgi:hypothetical protein
MTDPGFAVDLEVTLSLRALTAYWTGRRSWRELLGGGELRLAGDPWLRRSIERWLGRSSFAEVPRPGA